MIIILVILLHPKGGVYYFQSCQFKRYIAENDFIPDQISMIDNSWGHVLKGLFNDPPANEYEEEDMVLSVTAADVCEAEDNIVVINGAVCQLQNKTAVCLRNKQTLIQLPNDRRSS